MDVPKANARRSGLDKSSWFQLRDKAFSYFARMRSERTITRDGVYFSRRHRQSQLGI